MSLKYQTAELDDHFNYALYLTWSPEERWELIDGKAYNMSPSPGKKHQQISAAIFGTIWNHLKGKPCQVFAAPFDVRPLANSDQPDDEVDTVVQPDIIVVCDKQKIEERGVIGAPDIVIEILSPHTARNDLSIKFDLYELAGVKEYWIVHPIEEIIQVYELKNDRYLRRATSGIGDILEVPYLNNLKINVTDLFKEP